MQKQKNKKKFCVLCFLFALSLLFQATLCCAQNEAAGAAQAASNGIGLEKRETGASIFAIPITVVSVMVIEYNSI